MGHALVGQELGWLACMSTGASGICGAPRSTSAVAPSILYVALQVYSDAL